MGYVGNQTTNSFTSMAKQDITGNGGANYTLSHAVANEQEIEVFVNNVRQEGGVGKAYTVSGTALTMTGNVTSSDIFYVVYQGKAVGSIVPPDGTVTKAKIATTELDLATIKDSTGTNTAMTIDSSGKIKPTASGSVVSIRHYSNNTRASVTAGASGTLWTFTDTKLYGSESSIIIHANLIGKANDSGNVASYIEYGGTKSYSIGFTYEASTHAKLMSGTSKTTGKSAGSQTVNIGWDTANNQASQRPFQILNPNSSDDSRLHQTVSTVIVYEVIE